MSSIPIVIIAYNNLTFVESFVKQVRRLTNRIIIVDNCSTYPKLHEYYETIQKELGDLIEIRRKDRNYGHTVVWTQEMQHLPSVFAISDPDLQLQSEMPDNCLEQLLHISNKYKSRRVGLALDLSDHDKFIQRIHPVTNKTVYEGELSHWVNRIHDDAYELYNAGIDTTFCLINTGFENRFIRVAGVFSCKHLPWYENYIKDNIPEEELQHWRQNNVSSSILCVL